MSTLHSYYIFSSSCFLLTDGSSKVKKLNYLYEITILKLVEVICVLLSIIYIKTSGIEQYSNVWRREARGS